MNKRQILLTASLSTIFTLTIIISSISASDVTMLILPELAPYRILLAEIYAFFIKILYSSC